MEKRNEARWSVIEPELAITRTEAAETHVSMVLNAEHSQSTRDYAWHSVASEYLDDAEKSELMTGLRDAGFAVSVYEGETAFMRSVLSNTWDGRQFRKRYVFNTTGSGTGRARTSLVPSFCDLEGISLCSADGSTAALLENKFYTFRLLQALGFTIPATNLYVPGRGWNDTAPAIGTKVLCKPCRECSSIGVDERSVFFYEESKIAVIDEMSRAFRQPILVQDFIAGYEVEVPIFPCPQPISPAAIGIKIGERQNLGDAILANSTILAGSYDFYDFANIDPDLAERLKSETEKAYRTLCLSGLARVDWRITSDGRACITDFNTPPHLTMHSSCSHAFSLGGYDHADLMTLLVTVGRLNAASS